MPTRRAQPCLLTRTLSLSSSWSDRLLHVVPESRHSTTRAWWPDSSAGIPIDQMHMDDAVCGLCCEIALKLGPEARRDVEITQEEVIVACSDYAGVQHAVEGRPRAQGDSQCRIRP